MSTLKLSVIIHSSQYKKALKRTKLVHVNLVNTCDMGLENNINVQDNLGK